MTLQSPFAGLPELPEDPMFGLSAAYRADQHPDKVDLGVGAYRDEHARRWILPSVAQAEERIPLQDDHNHEYLPIAGHTQYLDASARLVFGQDYDALFTRRVATVQTLSGTGALHLGAALLAESLPAERKTVYLSNPPYVNHEPIFNHVGFDAALYPYFSSTRKGVDVSAMLDELNRIPQGSIVLLHACGHNPTGADPRNADWIRISRLMRRRSHIPFFDLAYQGFASGDPDTDAWAIRHFVAAQFPTILVAQSYAKSFGLYGQRVGCLHVLTDDESTTTRVLGMLKRIQRREVSTPPLHGARIVATILTDPTLQAQWRADLQHMAARLGRMRAALRARLEGLAQVPGSWAHLTEQRGMFCYTGLGATQVRLLREVHHVYLTADGRISVAGLNEANVQRVAEAVHGVAAGHTGKGLPRTARALL